MTKLRVRERLAVLSTRRVALWGICLAYQGTSFTSTAAAAIQASTEQDFIVSMSNSPGKSLLVALENLKARAILWMSPW